MSVCGQLSLVLFYKTFYVGTIVNSISYYVINTFVCQCVYNCHYHFLFCNEYCSVCAHYCLCISFDFYEYLLCVYTSI